MKDAFGREINYMRISITDRCNLRCRYCMPEGIQCVPMQDILTFEEIERVCREAVGLGITRFKITGGEPLVRLGCPALVRMIRRIPGVCEVTMTTNGVALKQYLPELLVAGLDAVNISLDTLDREKFRQITGFDRLTRVWDSIDAALESGLRVKINTVLQRGINDGEWEKLLLLAEKRALDVRFIELMPIGYGANGGMVSNVDLMRRIRERYPQIEPDATVHGNGPATYWRIPGFEGGVGFISAIHGKFCTRCNRIRMTAVGEVKPCLCYERSFDIRHALRDGSGDEVRETLLCAIQAKPDMHCFEEREAVTERRLMAKIGG
ncbi:MAG: GTP 3',8-cyclase MoaA [Clostridiales bacterium]|nr:GTP 3',8-cyclase MoaA [Clostridiales bacterium]